MPEETKPPVAAEPAPKLEDVQAELARAKDELDSVRGKVKKYSDEAAAARVARKSEYEEQITTLQKQLDELTTKKPGDHTSKGVEAEAAQLRAEIVDLKKKDQDRDQREKEREQKAKDLSHRNALTKLVAKNKLESPEDAVEILLRKTKLAEDGETVTFAAKDKDSGRVEDLALTEDNFEGAGLLGSVFWPPKGVEGSGAKKPKELGDVSGLDMGKVGDRAYWKKHKEKILEGSGVK